MQVLFTEKCETASSDCKIVRRRGRIYVICKSNPRFKAVQGDYDSLKQFLPLLLLMRDYSAVRQQHTDTITTNRRQKHSARPQKGIFADKDVKDRQLSDWDGVRQSVEPLPGQRRTDPVMQAKAAKNGDKNGRRVSRLLYKGYKTDVDMIGIENNIIEFHRGMEVDQRGVSACRLRSWRKLKQTRQKESLVICLSAKIKNSHAPKYIQFPATISLSRKKISGHYSTCI